MATVQFAPLDMKIEGQVHRAVGLSTGDTTDTLTINGGDVDVTVHLYGTVGGSTVVVQGSLAGAGGTFNTVDDAYGVAMSYTAIGVIKPVGPALTALKITVTGGAGVNVTADVYVVRKVRPH